MITNKKGIEQHDNCTMVIIDRYHKDKRKLIPGLYCENHGCLIQWLKPNDAKRLKSIGVDYLGATLEEKQKVKDLKSTFWIRQKELGL